MNCNTTHYRANSSSVPGDPTRQLTAQIHERYLAATEREARAGARIVLWSEVAGIGFDDDEAALIAKGQGVARAEGIYLGLPLYTYHHDGRATENKLLLIDPSGNVVLRHVKYGGNLLEGTLRGDGVLQTVSTPYGVISAAICWDADFVATVAQAGRNGTDILLVPAHDWRAITPLHGHMSVFRAVEDGVSVFRQADQGTSIATDPYGRVLAEQDSFTTTEQVLVAQVPTKGVATVYSAVGDLFGWASIGGFLIVLVRGIARGGRRTVDAGLAPQVPEGDCRSSSGEG